MCLSVLLNSLFQLDSVDLDAQQLVLEASVKCKSVIILHFSTWWLFLEQPHLQCKRAVQMKVYSACSVSSKQHACNITYREVQ
jgi:hypothetical protein